MATIRETKDGVFVRDFLDPGQPHIVDLDTTLAALNSGPGESHLVIHFHGGLVSTSNGLIVAQRLAKPLPDGISDPAFEQLSIVWGSGALETVVTNFKELVNDQLFDRVLKKVIEWASGRVLDLGGGARAIGHGLVSPQIETEIEKAKGDVEEDVKPEPFSIDPLADSEIADPGSADDPDAEAELAALLEADGTLQAMSNAIDAELRSQQFEANRAAIPQAYRQAASETIKRLNEEFTQTYQQEVGAATNQTRASLGLLAMKTIIKQTFKAGVAVVRRYINDRDHDFYPTVFEEVGRYLFAGKIGSQIWAFMKQDTADHFKAGGAGIDLLKKLDTLNANLSKNGRDLRITLLGHSAGAIFVGEMLKAMKNPNNELQLAPVDVILLAPAADFQSFADVLDRAESQIRHLTMLTMDDAHEKGDRLLGAFYPRSLLYLICGVLEFGQVDDPILGMDRFHREDQSDRQYSAQEKQALSRVAQFMAGPKVDKIWAVTADRAQSGDRSHANRHGSFDDEVETLTSVVARLKTAR